MAKALYGHLAADPVLLAEVSTLRRRVRELEGDLARLRAEHAQLPAETTVADAAVSAGSATGELSVDDLLTLENRQEPALT